MENEQPEQKIVGAARAIFIENGYNGTSMSDIAAAAGINRTTLHYYFRTKDRMFRAVFGSIMLEILPRIQVIFDEDIPLTQKFSKVLDVYLEMFMENPALPRFIMGEINRDVDLLLDTGRELNLDKYLLSVAQVLCREAERGAIRDVPPQIVMLAFMSQVTFPFLVRNLLSSLLLDAPEEFEAFVAEWKKSIVRQMSALLAN